MSEQILGDPAFDKLAEAADLILESMIEMEGERFWQNLDWPRLESLNIKAQQVLEMTAKYTKIRWQQSPKLDKGPEPELFK